MASKLVSWLTRALGTAEAPARMSVERTPSAESRYHAVGIKPGEVSCAAAKQFGRMRFLAASAPRFPLPGCDLTECACRYSHFSDRRDGSDRRAVYDAEHERALKVVNRRSNHGRRVGDPIS